MSYYSLLNITPTDTDWIPAYTAVVTSLVEKHHGKYLARTASHEQLEGEGDTSAIRVIIEWPTKQNALSFMADPEYVPLLKSRTAGSISHHFLVEGTDDLA